MTPEGWRSATYGQVMAETEHRADEATELPVLSVTKTRGPMLASERFGKVMHGRDLKKYRVAHRGSVVADPMLLWDGSIGLQTVVDAGLVSPDYRVYQPAKDVDPRFLGYLVRSPMMLPHYQGGARGTNVRRNRIARSDFLAIPVALPPLPEQRNIAAILCSVDQAVHAAQTVIDQLQVVKRAMMAELLARGLPGRHKRFKQTELGEVPEEWQVVRMDTLADPKGMVGGPFGSDLTAKDYVKEPGVPVIRGGNVSMGRFTEEDYVFVSREKASALAKNSATLGDLVMTQRGASLGEVTLIPPGSQYDFYIISQTMMRMTPDVSKVSTRFILHYTCSPAAQKWLQAHQVATGQPHLNLGIYRAMPALVPGWEEQAAIADAMDRIDETIDANTPQFEQLKRVKSALTAVLLTGEVRVKPDEEAA